MFKAQDIRDSQLKLLMQIEFGSVADVLGKYKGIRNNTPQSLTKINRFSKLKCHPKEEHKKR